MSRLDITEAAMNVAWREFTDSVDHVAALADAITAAAPLIVASELRRLADEFQALRDGDDHPIRSFGLSSAIHRIRVRAFNLDQPGGAS
jgi:hypothetical protein